MRLRNSPSHDMQGNGNELSSHGETSEFVKLYILMKWNIVRTYSCWYYVFNIHVIITSPIFDFTHKHFALCEDLSVPPWGCFNIQTSFYQFKDSHYKDEMAVFLLIMHIPNQQNGFYIEKGPIFSQWQSCINGVNKYHIGFTVLHINLHLTEWHIQLIPNGIAQTLSHLSWCKTQEVFCCQQQFCLTSENTSNGSFHINSISYTLH